MDPERPCRRLLTGRVPIPLPGHQQGQCRNDRQDVSGQLALAEGEEDQRQRHPDPEEDLGVVRAGAAARAPEAGEGTGEKGRPGEEAHRKDRQVVPERLRMMVEIRHDPRQMVIEPEGHEEGVPVFGPDAPVPGNGRRQERRRPRQQVPPAPFQLLDPEEIDRENAAEQDQGYGSLGQSGRSQGGSGEHGPDGVAAAGGSITADQRHGETGGQRHVGAAGPGEDEEQGGGGEDENGQDPGTETGQVPGETSGGKRAKQAQQRHRKARRRLAHSEDAEAESLDPEEKRRLLEPRGPFQSGCDEVAAQEHLFGDARVAGLVGPHEGKIAQLEEKGQVDGQQDEGDEKSLLSHGGMVSERRKKEKGSEKRKGVRPDPFSRYPQMGLQR